MSVAELQVAIVREMHRRMHDLARATHDVIKILERTGEPSKREYSEKFVVMFNEFDGYIRDNRIFLPTGLAENLAAYKRAVRASYWAFTHRKEDDDDRWLKSVEDFEQTALPLLPTIEQQFREVLGVEAQKNPPPTFRS
jgi:hypothetical protein